MRPAILLGALGVAGAVVALAVSFSHSPNPTAVVAAVEQPPPAPLAQPHPALRPINPAPLPSVSASVSPAVENIIVDLAKPDRASRQDALRRIRERDERGLIARLQELAAQTDDPDEKRDILDTIDFLNTPDLAENMAAVHASRASAGQADPPRSPTNRWTGRPFPTTP